MTLKMLFLSGCALLTGLCSCTRQNEDALTRAERLLVHHPDSALALLDSIHDRMDHAPTEQRIYFHLLLTEAQDRNYMSHTSDSLIIAIIRHYEQTEEREKLMKAYYYAGRVYSDLNDVGNALSYYHKALDLSDKNSSQATIGRIHSQMGTLFAFQDMDEEVMQAYRKAHHHFSLSDDSLMLPYTLRDIGRAFQMHEQTDSAIVYYSRGAEKARQNADTLKERYILRELSMLYIEQKRYEEALQAMLLTSPKHVTSNHIIWAEFYRSCGKPDSAKTYFLKTIEQGNRYARCEAFYNLYEMEKEEGDCAEAMRMLEHHTQCVDSIYQENKAESLRKIRAIYNFRHMEEEEQRLRRQNRHQKAGILGIIFLVVGSISVSYRYGKRKKHLREERERLLYYLYEKQYQRSRQYIEANKQKIAQLEVNLESALQQNNELQRNLLLAQKEQLEQTIHSVEALNRSQELQEDRLRRSEIYRRCYAATSDPNIVLTDEEWEELQRAVDEAYDDFSNRLFILHPHLTLMELHICLLLKIGIPVSTISQLVCRTQSAVSMGRKQLYKKIFRKDGTPAMLDRFIAEF